ncbi:MAG: hypothetical protein PSN34_15885 [Urechidicola sp.]|nr:hypothetical protein [Urechidicola sp.]
MQKYYSVFTTKSFLFYLFIFFTAANFGQQKSIELNQQFGINSGVSKSKAFQIDYKNTSPFIMLSAYTKDVVFDDVIYYRLMANETWEDWRLLEDSHDSEIYDRVVFGPAYIEQAFEEIQFKTKNPSNSSFVFRLFFPKFTKSISEKKK